MKNLNEMKSIELKQLAKNNKVPSWWSLKKDELIAALEEVLNNNEAEEVEAATIEEPIEVEELEEVEEATEEVKIPEGYEATVIDNTIVMVSRNEYAEADEDIAEDESDEPETSEDESNEPDEDTDALQAELEEVERQIAELQARKKEIKAKMKKSKTSSHEKLIEYNGKNQSLTAWAKELGFKGQTLFGRIYEMGWSVEKAFTTPVKSRTKKVEE